MTKVKKMKIELTLVLKTNDRAYETLQEIKQEGYNATVMSSESLRHAIDYYPGEHHFINLRQIEKGEMLESMLCVFIVEKDKLDHLKDVIRWKTDNFNKIKGFMYSRPIDDFEGSI